MNDVKHTPGPWCESPSGAWYAANEDANTLAWGAISGARGKMVAMAVTLDQHESPELSANMSLIAAAPEMLEALKNIENDDGHIPSTIWGLVRTAIAKAEGRA